MKRAAVFLVLVVLAPLVDAATYVLELWDEAGRVVDEE